MAARESEIERAIRLAAHLPEVLAGSWYGTPALMVRGRSFVRVKEPGVLVVLCPLELKEALIEAEPERFFETDHYKGWPAFLVRLDAIDDDRLRDRIETAWLEKAPERLAREWLDGARTER